MSAHAASADAGPRPAGARLRARALSRRAGASGALTTVALAALVVAVVFEARGGLQLQTATRVEVGADLLAGLAGAAALLAGARTRRSWGLGTLGAFALLAALTALSILWAVNPGGAWEEANRTIAHVAVLALGLALVRLAPGRWASVLGAVVLASVAVCGYALLSKVFPSALAHDEVYARLREPFGYWNAVGLTAAMGVPGCVWLGPASHGPRARHGAGLPGARAAAGRPAPGLLARLAARPGRRAGAVVRGRAAAPARRRRAGHERGGRGARRPVGLRPARPERGQGRPRGAHGGRLGVRARPAGARRRPARRRPGRRLRDGHAARRAPSARRQAGVVVLVVVGLVPVAVLAASRSPSAGWAARSPRAGRTSPTPARG